MMSGIIAGIKAAVTAAVNFLSTLPVSGIIKGAALIGGAIYCAWTLIQHVRKSKKQADEKEFHSPVDELLNRDYSNPENYDTLEDLATEIGDDLFKKNRKAKKRAKKRRNMYRNAPIRTNKEKSHRREVQKTAKSILDLLEERLFKKNPMADVDEAARDLGFDVPTGRKDRLDGIDPLTINLY